MKTIYYYYILAILAAVFALNSCSDIESKEQVEKRSRAALKEYFSDYYGGVECEIKTLKEYRADTLSAAYLREGIKIAVDIYGSVANGEQMEVINGLDRQLIGQPTIIIYSWNVTFRIKMSPAWDETQNVYGLYNTRTKELKLSRDGFKKWNPAIPEPYSKAIVLLNELFKR